MAKCKKGRTISTHLSFELARILESRSEDLGWSVSRYLGYILEDWYAQGCPAINNIEESMGIPSPNLKDEYAFNKETKKKSLKALKTRKPKISKMPTARNRRLNKDFR